jgi:hypothetical protein
MMTYRHIRHLIRDGQFCSLDLVDAVSNELAIWAVYPSQWGTPSQARALIGRLRAHFGPALESQGPSTGQWRSEFTRQTPQSTLAPSPIQARQLEHTRRTSVDDVVVDRAS